MRTNWSFSVSGQPYKASSNQLSAMGITVLLHAAILFVPFHDLNLPGGIGGIFLRSIAAVPLLGIAVIVLSKLIGQKVNVFIAAWLIGVFFVTLFYIFSYNFQFLGENLIAKAVNTTILLSVFFLPTALTFVDISRFKISIYITFGTLLFAYYVGDVLKIPLFSEQGPLHALPNIQQRPRGFALEASVFASQLMIMGALAAAVTKNKVMAPFFLLIPAIILLDIGSKGGTVSTILAAGLMCLFISPSRPLLATAMVFFGAIAGTLLYGSFAEVLQLLTTGSISVSTRMTLLLAAISVLITHPLGVGLGTLAPELQSSIVETLPIISEVINSPFRLNEIYNNMIRTETDRYLTTKIGLWDFLLLTGFPGLYFFFAHLSKPLFRPAIQKNLPLIFGTFFTIIALSSYVSLVGCYHFAIFLIFANSLLRTDKN